MSQHNTDETIDVFCSRYLLDGSNEEDEGFDYERHGEEAIIIVNSVLPKHLSRFWNGSTKVMVVCADGGANRLHDFWETEEQRASHIPNIIRGDLDSIRPEVKLYYQNKGAEIIHNLDQDTTDLTKCLSSVPPSKRTLVMGAFGGNFSQEISNINSLYNEKDRSIVLLGEENAALLFLPGKSYNVHCRVGPKVGLLPIGSRCRSCTSTGLRWNLNDTPLEFGDLVSTSNEMKEKRGTIRVSDAIIWTTLRSMCSILRLMTRNTALECHLYLESLTFFDKLRNQTRHRDKEEHTRSNTNMRATGLLLIFLSIVSCTFALRLEAEHGHVIGNAVHRSQMEGFSNNAYVSLVERGRLILTVNAQSDRAHPAAVHYTSLADCGLSVQVNGHSHPQSYIKSSSRGVHQLRLHLRRGINTIVFEHLYGHANIDFLDIPGLLPLNSRGATVQYYLIEAEDATHTGQQIGPDRTYQQLPSEASGRKAVQISGDSFVEFTLSGDANAMAIRFSIPDSADGSGQKVAQLRVTSSDGYDEMHEVTSKFSWAYGSYPFTKHPSDGGPHHFYDDIRFLFNRTLSAGDKVKVQGVTTGMTYTIDLADFYTAPEPYTQPKDPFVSVVDYGADPTGQKDSTDAIQKAIDDASANGKVVWLPQGRFAVKARFTLDKVTVRGAGPWYTEVFATVNHGVGFFSKTADAGGSTNVNLFDFSITGLTNVRDDSQADSGTGGAPSLSLFQNLWIEHTKCGMWLDGPFDGLHVVGTTMRNTYADGVNFHLGVTNSVVEQCDLRNLGDDGLAMWSEKKPDVGNVFKFNTVKVPVLANGIAIYGGRDNSATDNYVAESICDGAGLQVANRFDAIALSGHTDMSRNVIERCGAPSRFGAWHNGAIWVWANQGPITNVTFEDVEIYNSSWAGVTFWDGNSDVTFKNVTVDTADWVFELHSCAGKAELTNVVARNIAVVGIASCVGGGFTFDDITGNDYPNTTKCMGF
ncbi:coagulation factor 5/8 type domain-containing protein [Planoprotostelium fungivorum]|uniref:Coagulation factor 5/8 type domain-containing protein n=1 Tax=Planoprotostelium fungivorum TaxID=1890364 RepID=A0A2P6NF65_9EUKA|nr:coagulation factor 5/8 type domain-containing protein [Planoprotostelium fungivorum]